MNDSPIASDSAFWHHIGLMIALAFTVFASIEYIPTILGGVAGTIATITVAGVFLYYFGKHTGSLLVESES